MVALWNRLVEVYDSVRQSVEAAISARGALSERVNDIVIEAHPGQKQWGERT